MMKSLEKVLQRSEEETEPTMDLMVHNKFYKYWPSSFLIKRPSPDIARRQPLVYNPKTGFTLALCRRVRVLMYLEKGAAKLS